MTRFDGHANFAYSSVLAVPSPATSGTSLQVQTPDADKFPTPPFNATIWPANLPPLKSNSEIVRVTAGPPSSNVFTITRAQEGTTARTILAGDQIANSQTVKVFDDIEDAITQKTFITVGTAAGADYVCDGVGDHSEINSAIIAVNAAGGGIVQLLTGTYLISGNINGLSNVILQGEGDATVIKQADSANVAGSVWNVTTQTNFQIRDLKYDGNKANNPTSGRGITFTNSSYCCADNITITNTKDHSLNLRSPNTTYCVVNNCRITNSDGSAFIISNGASYNRVVNCTANTILFTGFYVTGTGADSTGNSFINCYAESCDYGFDVYASTNCRAENCRSKTTVRDNFHVEDSYDISYVSCIGTGSGRDAFAVYSSDLDSKRSTNITFEACKARGAALNGFHFIGQVIAATTYTVFNMKVIGGEATGNARYGIQSIYTTGLVIDGVTLDANGGATYEGITLDSNTVNATIQGNAITNNGNNPIKLLDSTVDKVSIADNILSGNGGTNTITINTATNVEIGGNPGYSGTDLQRSTSFFGLVSFTGTTHAGLKLNSLTTTQRNTLTPANGMVVYNSTTSQTQRYENSAWKTLASRAFVTVGTADADYICDGTADEVEINAAITSLGATGGTVYLLPGTYTITSSVKLTDNIRLVGSGFSTTLKYANGSHFNGLIRCNDTTNGNDNIIIADLQIDGNFANTTYTPPQDMVWLPGATNFIVERCYIHNTPDSAIVPDLTTAQNGMIRENTIDTTNDIGLYIAQCSGMVITDNIVRNTNSYGIRCTYAGNTENIVANNRVSNCGLVNLVAGIICQTAGAEENLIQGNYVTSCYKGIEMNTVAYCSVVGNYIRLPQTHGIYLTGAGRGVCTGNVIRSASQLASNTYSGIYLNSATDWTVTGNRSGDIGSGTRQKYGVEEAGTSDNNTITGNMLDRNGTAGMLILGTNTIYGLNRV